MITGGRRLNGTIAISSIPFVKQGYSFNGWEAANGNVYYPGDTYTLGVEAVTFAARWVKTSDINTVYVKPGAVGSGDFGNGRAVVF